MHVQIFYHSACMHTIKLFRVGFASLDVLYDEPNDFAWNVGL